MVIAVFISGPVLATDVPSEVVVAAAAWVEPTGLSVLFCVPGASGLSVRVPRVPVVTFSVRDVVIACMVGGGWVRLSPVTPLVSRSVYPWLCEGPSLVFLVSGGATIMEDVSVLDSDMEIVNGPSDGGGSVTAMVSLSCPPRGVSENPDTIELDSYNTVEFTMDGTVEADGTSVPKSAL